MMRGHRIGLSNAQLRAMKSLSNFVNSHDFYLAGGTAVSIRLGHRRSIDLDYFTNTDFDEHKLANELRKKIGFNVRSVGPNTIHGSLNRVSISFITFGHALIDDTDQWKPFDTPIASEADLITMKLNAIVNRGAKKDFVDLFALMRSGWTIEESIELFKSRFGLSGAEHLIKAMTYFVDADEELTPKAFWDMDWRNVKRSIRESVQDYLKSNES